MGSSQIKPACSSPGSGGPGGSARTMPWHYTCSRSTLRRPIRVPRIRRRRAAPAGTSWSSSAAPRRRPFLTFGGCPPVAGSSRRDRRGGAYPSYDGHAVEAESAGGRDSRPQAPQQIREVTSAPATSYASSLSALGVFTGNDTTGTGESTLSNSSRRAW